MINILECTRDFSGLPDLSKFSDAEILSIIDPIKINKPDLEFDHIKEVNFETPELRAHLIINENKQSLLNPGKSLFHMFDLLKMTNASKFFRIIKMSDSSYVLAYQNYEDKRDTTYLEEFIEEILRLATTLAIYKPSEFVDLINKHISTTTLINHEAEN